MKALCNGVKRPNNHVIPSKGLITRHALMPSLPKKNNDNELMACRQFTNFRCPFIELHIRKGKKIIQMQVPWFITQLSYSFNKFHQQLKNITFLNIWRISEKVDGSMDCITRCWPKSCRESLANSFTLNVLLTVSGEYYYLLLLATLWWFP